MPFGSSAAPLAWNSVQKEWELSNLVPLHVFKARIDAMQSDCWYVVRYVNCNPVTMLYDVLFVSSVVLCSSVFMCNLIAEGLP